VLGAVVGLGTISGPLLGGLLLQADLWGLGWRPIFLINLPVGIVALIGATALVRESRSDNARGLDFGGVALISLALLLVIYPIIEGRALGWPLWLFGISALGLVVLGIFALDQRRKAARGAAPLVDPALFQDRAFRLGLPISLIFFSGVYSFFLALAICLQAGFGFTPLASALLIIPFQSTTLVTSLLSARLVKRLGGRVLLIGGVLLCLGVGGVIFALAQQGAALSSWPLTPILIVGGAGFGLIIGPLTTIILAGVQPAMAASASGVLSTAQQIGGALGIAIVGTLLFGQLEALDATLRHALRFNLAAFAVTLALFVLLVVGERRAKQRRADETANVLHVAEP
jgi:predicted MFS family arabinose efflux permease